MRYVLQILNDLWCGGGVERKATLNNSFVPGSAVGMRKSKDRNEP